MDLHLPHYTTTNQPQPGDRVIVDELVACRVLSVNLEARTAKVEAIWPHRYGNKYSREIGFDFLELTGRRNKLPRHFRKFFYRQLTKANRTIRKYERAVRFGQTIPIEQRAALHRALPRAKRAKELLGL